MAIIKCKMCGGDLEIQEGQSVGVCEYCGRKQTLPRLDSDRKANLYDRANHFRRNNDYDKAMGIYETILNEDTSDAEAYWSLVLCRYGIEYVEDPGTHKRVPTVNRAQYTSIYADEDYKSAITNADSAQKAIYEEEAAAIDQLQKRILEISQKEKPFDVFICYKETDSSGRRTADSVLANDLYHQLVQEGFKVFFSRITLEDKLGQEYEPYIFGALHSAKIMIVLGTKPEYLNSVWVKNEWSRYLALIRSGEKKTLIPAYKDMDPYDLPEEFSHLQAQDMSKLGFIQDLIRGIHKIMEPEGKKSKKTVYVGAAAEIGNTDALLKRGYMALDDQEWEKATEFFEKVLNQNAECGKAYLGELLAQQKCSNLSELVAFHLENNKPVPEKLDGFMSSVYSDSAFGSAEERTGLIGAEPYGEYPENNPSYLKHARTSQLDAEKSYWKEHKLLNHALQYSDAETAESIKAALQDLYTQMAYRIQEGEREEKNILERMEATKPEDYENAQKILTESDDFKEISNAIRTLEQMGDYKEAKALREQGVQKVAKILLQKAVDDKKREENKVLYIRLFFAGIFILIFLISFFSDL